MSRSRCTWCIDPDAEDDDGTLCRMHEAECHGSTVADMERGEREQYAEWVDTLGR